MAVLSVYLDASVWNYPFNDHVPELQAETRAFFDRVRADASIRSYLSDAVLQELEGAPAERLPRLAELIQ